jgi:hypothetical protein
MQMITLLFKGFNTLFLCADRYGQVKKDKKQSGD